MTARTKTDATWLEQGGEMLLDFDKIKKVARSGESVVPVAVQDVGSKAILLIAYANEDALRHTMERGVATFWSTSRNELWIKGATSGDTLEIVEIRVNCDQNSLLYIVRPLGEGACHTKDADGRARSSCFYRRIRDAQLEFVHK